MDRQTLAPLAVRENPVAIIVIIRTLRPARLKLRRGGGILGAGLVADIGFLATFIPVGRRGVGKGGQAGGGNQAGNNTRGSGHLGGHGQAF